MQVKLREEIDNSLKWKLEDIYSSEDLFQKDMVNAQEIAKKIETYQGKLTSKDNILAVYKLEDELNFTIGKLYAYAHMRLDQDCTQTKYKELKSQVENVLNTIISSLAFVRPEILENDVEFLKALAKDKDFANYDYDLEKLIKNKTHSLSTKEEVLLAKVSKFSELFEEAFSMFDNADVRFDNVTLDDGSEIELSHGIYSYYLQTGSREERRKVFDSMFNAYKRNINVITSLYKGNLEKDWFYAQARNYKSCLEMKVSNEDVSINVYKKLIENIHANLPLLHDYMKYRKDTLGFDELHMYDLHMPLIKGVDKDIEYDEAKNIVLKALEPLGDEYHNLLIEAFNNGWIDVCENKGKRSGAYSSGCFGVHPYVLLNYKPVLNDVFTIAHELGHAMHSYYSNETQPISKAEYEIFVAEVASTVNETLLVMHLLKDAKGDYRKYLLSYLANMFRTTIFRQAQFAEFEEKAHDYVEKDVPITPDLLCNLYYDLNKEYYGKDVVSDELIRYEWARIPHFYSSFYVYKYSTGLISAICIASDILSKGDDAIKAYKKFLKAGGSQSPVEILKLANVDLESDEPYKKAMEFYKNTINDLMQA